MAGHPPNVSFMYIRENKSETGAPNAGHTIQQIWVFNAIQIAGFLFNGAILLTVLLSSNVRRTPTWFGLMASWMVFTLSNLLIVGHQIGPDPGFGICLTQAGFVYASPVLISFYGVAFILQLYLTVSNVFNAAQAGAKRNVFLLLAPPVLFVGIFVEVLVQGLLDQKLVQRNATGMFCHLTQNLATIITGFTVSCAMTMMLTLEALTATIVYRNWAAFRHQTKPVRSNGMLSLTMIIRSAIFSLLSLLIIVLSGASLSIPDGSRSDAALNIVVGSLPLAVALTFGTQADIVRVWMFWKKDVLPPPAPITDSGTTADKV